jgi:superfamily II DNA/RNA helicase
MILVKTRILTRLYFRPQNMIAQSQSGTGKTAAFVLTMLSRVDISSPATQVNTVIMDQIEYER